MTRRRVLLSLGGLALIGVVVLGFASRDLGPLRPWVTGSAAEALGLEVTVAGRLGLALLPTPGIAARDVHVATPDDAPARLSATIERIDIGINPFRWLFDDAPGITRIGMHDVKLDLDGDPQALADSIGPQDSDPASASTPTSPVHALLTAPDLELSAIAVTWVVAPDPARELTLHWGTLSGSGTRRLVVDLAATRDHTPLDLHVELSRSGSGIVDIETFRAEAGETRLQGSGTLSKDGSRLEAILNSDRIDLRELFDAAPGDSDDHSLEQPLPEDLLPDIHTDITLAFKRLKLTDDVSVERLEAKLAGSPDGLNLQIEKATLLGGDLHSTASIRSPSAGYEVQLALKLEQLELAELPYEHASERDGKLDLEFKLDGRGKTGRQILADLEGNVMLSMGELVAPDSRIGLLGRNILALAFADDDSKQTVRLNCAVLRSNFEQGVGKTQGLIDTKAATLAIHGLLDLQELQVYGVVKPEPKKTGIGGLTTPFEITGPIMDPKIGTDTLRVAADTGKILALGFLNPALMIVPFVDLGKDGNPCQGALASRLKQPIEQESLVGRVESGVKQKLSEWSQGLEGSEGSSSPEQKP